MIYKNSIAIIHTQNKSGHIVGSHSIATYNYQQARPNQFAYDYLCDEFEIKETVGGELLITTFRRLNFSSIEIKEDILFSNVANVEIHTEYSI
ncbi:MAG: hypothetical protein HDT44_08830 [Ruminococcaceae bacterium]|nr:hypothetical protein [Oscillospiraceae bacterium]